LRTVKIKNTTGITVNIKCGERCYSIKSGGREYIDIEENNVICVFRSDEKSLRLCLSLYLSKESVRNIWIFAPQAVVNLFSFFKVQPGVREINISQRKCSPFLCTVFNVFVFNGNDADSYAYVNKRDKAAVDFGADGVYTR